MSCMPHPLPPELIDRILDFLHDDWRTLVTCVQAAPRSHLAPCARFHLSDISVPISDSAKPYTEVQDFLHTFASDTDFPPLVHSLTIYGDRSRPLTSQPNGGNGTDYITPFVAPKLPILLDLSHLSHLHTLALSRVRVDILLPERFARFLCALPALDTLSLSSIGWAVTNETMRLVRDAAPTRTAKDALRARLATLRIFELDQIDHDIWSYDSLFGVLVAGELALKTVVLHFPFCCHLELFERWLKVVCVGAARTLTNFDVTLVVAVQEESSGT